MTKALRKKEVRKRAAAAWRWMPSDLAHLGEGVGFITEPQFILFKARRLSEESFRDAMNSNNPLAVKPETENDLAVEDFPRALKISGG
jgi:hypothetical protein